MLEIISYNSYGELEVAWNKYIPLSGLPSGPAPKTKKLPAVPELPERNKTAQEI